MQFTNGGRADFSDNLNLKPKINTRGKLKTFGVIDSQENIKRKTCSTRGGIRGEGLCRQFLPISSFMESVSFIFTHDLAGCFFVLLAAELTGLVSFLLRTIVRFSTAPYFLNFFPCFPIFRLHLLGSSFPSLHLALFFHINFGPSSLTCSSLEYFTTYVFLSPSLRFWILQELHLWLHVALCHIPY